MDLQPTSFAPPLLAALLAAVLAGCDKEPPSLLPELDGQWAGWVLLEAGASDATATFRWDEEEAALTGEIVVQEDPGDRVWTLIEANSIEGFGITLVGVEQAGVRRLLVDAIADAEGPPFDPVLTASWRTSWFCAGEPDGYCHDDGYAQLERR